MSRLVLGTVQLGMDYGVANQHGQPSFEEALSIVQTAWDGGVRQFDTAQGYGESEVVLGHAFRELSITDKVKVTSKLHPKHASGDVNEVMASVKDSLDRLGVTQLDCLMWHRESVLDGSPDDVVSKISALREQGLAASFGVSVYSPAAATKALKSDWCNVVQIPGNILDRRFENAGVFDLALQQGKTLCLRSIFLQGLLLMALHKAVEKVPPAEKALRMASEIANQAGVSLLTLCIAYVREAYPNVRILFGAEAANQVEEVLMSWQTPLRDGLHQRIINEFSSVDERIVNPVMWKEFEA
jgi:Predicted oxidoreductases (related to aryl-alcohol dehydrogenases)